MLLGAEWRPHMMCFVKQHKHEPNESDGFVWPAPTFEFFDREGRPIEGPRKQDLHKLCNPVPKFNVPDFRNKSVFDHNLINRKLNKSFTATEVFQNMKASEKILDELTSKAADKMAKDIDDHLLDALLYGSMSFKSPPMSFADVAKDAGITINNRHDLKVLRPGLGVYKIPDA